MRLSTAYQTEMADGEGGRNVRCQLTQGGLTPVGSQSARREALSLPRAMTGYALEVPRVARLRRQSVGSLHGDEAGAKATR